ncbi:putative helicase, ATP-dependent [Paenibacillus sp. NAIST15-1]|nr:putative helicase, ATP-dependent [Paenibacillus sp. NAIST15-1]
MASYKNFQSDNAKHTKNRLDTRNPEFNPTVSSRGVMESDSFTQNLDKYSNFVSWARFYPDLWWDLITPPTGGIRLDLDQRIYLRCVARFISNYMVFPRGYGKCVSGDTILFTEGGMKEIGSFFDYDESGKERYIVKNIKLVNRFGELESTNAGVYSGKLPTRVILTEEGYELESSLNHPVLVMTDSGEVAWKRTEDILIGDYIVINRNNDKWGKKITLNVDMDSFLDSFGKSSRWKIEKSMCSTPTILTEQLALILGYLVGDGCLTMDNRIIFTSKDEDIISNYINFFSEELNIEVKKKTDIDYYVNGKYVREYFKQLGLEQVDAYRKEIPKVILESPKDFVSSFIRGLFDTDGGLSNTYIEYCTASKKLSKQVQSVLLNFGIVSTRSRKFNKEYKTYSYRITITGKDMDLFYKYIGFSCKRKQDKLVDLCRDIKRNTNKDIIPYQHNLVRAFYNKAKNHNSYLYDKVYHLLKGNNNLTYEKLDHLLNLENVSDTTEYFELKNLSDTNYFYSRVKQINNSENHVYDLSLPETHSFVSNGFVSHNTLLEIMAMVHACIFYPDIEISMTAQTRENAAKLVDEKFREILRFYPMIQNEIQGRPSFSKDSVEIVFTSGARIDVMANAQSSKGARRKRLNVEESNLLNNALFEDVLEPIVNVPRRTIGSLALINPEELNGQINFMTTSGFRGSSEFERNISMLDEMAELKGKIVIGSDWQLAVNYSRGEPRSTILDKKSRLSPTFFAMNYESKWVGASDSALVSINKVIDLRTLKSPELKGDERYIYILSVDVARSLSQNNNKTSISVLKIKKTKDQKISKVSLVNLINLPNGLNFTAQAIEIKKIKKRYGAKVVVVDVNGVGVGLKDELLKETIDPITEESLGCWDTINTEDEPDIVDSEKIVYALMAQGINHDIIVNFIDMVESCKLQLLIKNTENNYEVNDTDYFNNNVLPHVQTDLLLEEVANLKLKQTQNGKYTVEQLTKRVDKDRYSSLVMGLWYIKEFLSKVEEENEDDYMFFMQSGF